MGSHDAQQCGTLHYFKAVGTEVGQSLMAVGDGRGIDYQRALRVAAVVWYQVGVLVKVDVNTLLLERPCQVARGAVIACHTLSFGKKIAFQGCHPNAPGTDKIQ